MMGVRGESRFFHNHYWGGGKGVVRKYYGGIFVGK